MKNTAFKNSNIQLIFTLTHASDSQHSLLGLAALAGHILAAGLR